MTRTIDARRLSRALDLVIADAIHPVAGQPGLFAVTASNGRECYLVNVNQGSCTCPDAARHPGTICKHEGSALMILAPAAPKAAPTQGRFIGAAGAAHLLEPPEDANPFD